MSQTSSQLCGHVMWGEVTILPGAPRKPHEKDRLPMAPFCRLQYKCEAASGAVKPNPKSKRSSWRGGTRVPDNLNTQKSCCYWASLTCKEDKGPGSLSVVLMGFECMHLHLLVTVLRRSWEKITAEVKSRWDFKGEEKWWNLIVWQNNVLKEH